MKHIHWLYGAVVLLMFATACTEEEEKLTPTGYERDWTIITEPKDGNPMEQLRYEIYRDFGVSTYYNDTIGREERTDILETPYTYYEILKVYYNPGYAKPGGYFDLFDDPQAISLSLEGFRDYFLHYFNEPNKLHNYLFVDSLWDTEQQNVKEMLWFYQGYTTDVIRVKPGYDSFTEEEKKSYFEQLLIYHCSGKMMSGNNRDWTTAFFELSQSLMPKREDGQYKYAVYSSDTTYGRVFFERIFDNTEFSTKEEIGFIVSTWVEDWSGEIKEACPTRDEDIQSYVQETLHYTEEEFNARYPDYPLIQTKYRLVRNKMREIGIKVAE